MVPTPAKKLPTSWESLPLRARKAAKTRIGLFAAGRDACEKRRFADIKVAELCEAVGVTEPTFYKYFPEKSDLLVLGIMLWGVETAWKLSRLPKAKTSLQRIDWLFAESARGFVSRPGFTREILARQATRAGPPKFLEVTIAERLYAFPGREGIERFPGCGIVALVTPLVRTAKRRELSPSSPSVDVLVQALVSIFLGVPIFTLWEDPSLVGRRYRQQLKLLWRGAGAAQHA